MTGWNACHGNERHDRPRPEENTLRLFDVTPELRYPERPETIAELFDEFHRLNPWVMDALAQLAREEIALGSKRVSVDYLFHVLRYHYRRATTDPHSEFRLNNNLTSRYARELMERYADLAGAFSIRELRTA